MAVYRSDQAQLTFATEAAQGGDPEMAEGVLQGSGTTAVLNGVHKAGSRTVTTGTVSTSTFTVGDFIRIGTVHGTVANTTIEHEIRRIELIDGLTLVLDRPLAFYHASGEEVKEINAVGETNSAHTLRNDKNKFITFIPGVYESVDTPDPEMSHEGRRFLGTQSKRNWSVSYPGQQTLTGSVTGMVLLNGWPLRYPIGKVTTIPSAVTGSATLAADAKKGDVYITLSSSHGVVAEDIIAIYDAANENNATKTTEVRKCVLVPGGQTTVIKLNYPLSFDHSSGAYVREQNSATYYNHEIVETVDLDTVSWHVHMLPSDEDADKAFDRRYVGGMIGSSTISAEEGGMVTMSWDSVNFLNMMHNQQNSNAVGTSSGDLYYGAVPVSNMPRFALMQNIDMNDVGMATQAVASVNSNTQTSSYKSYPNTQPYYFSQGLIKFFGQEFARIRSFSLSISNGEEPRYYLGRQGNRARGPYEIKEGPREYSMSASVVLPDASIDSNAAAADASRDGALELFKELLLEGDYGGSTAATARAGFTASLRFDRGTNDYIIIDIPGSTTAGSPTAGSNAINSQGIFINTAPHGLTTDNPFQVDVDMMFRSIKINIRDNEPFYP